MIFFKLLSLFFPYINAILHLKLLFLKTLLTIKIMQQTYSLSSKGTHNRKFHFFVKKNMLSTKDTAHLS